MDLINKKLLVKQEQTLEVLVHCPTTGEQIVLDNSERVYIPDERVTWWHCLACQGWHILPDQENQVR